MQGAETSSEPPRLSPRLPPETLYHICIYIKGPVESPDNILDLMAFALVEKDWCAVATPLFEGLLCRLCYTRPLSITRRLSTLLSESRQYRLTFCEKFPSCEIIVDEYIREVLNDHLKPRNPYSDLFEHAKPGDVDALFNVIRLTSPKNLKIVVGYPGGSEERLREREKFFKRLSESINIGAIQKLEVSFFKEWYQPKDQPNDSHLASFIGTMRNTLTAIKLEHDPDDETLSALSSLRELRTASIFFFPIRKAGTILGGAPFLRTLILESLFGDGADSLFASVAPAHLEELTLASVPDMSARTGIDRFESLMGTQPIAQALEALIASAPRLARLYFLDLPYVSNAIVRAVAQTCRDIEHLCLPAASGLNGNEVWSDQIRPWPKLRYIHTSEPMTTAFVQPILEECEKLEEVAFGEAGDGGDERVEMFERGGFYLYGPGWRRDLEFPTDGGGS